MTVDKLRREGKPTPLPILEENGSKSLMVPVYQFFIAVTEYLTHTRQRKKALMWFPISEGSFLGQQDPKWRKAAHLYLLAAAEKKRERGKEGAETERTEKERGRGTKRECNLSDHARRDPPPPTALTS